MLRSIPLNIYKHVLEVLSRRRNENGQFTILSQSSFATSGTAIGFWHEISNESRDPASPPIVLTDEHRTFYSNYAKGRKRMLAGFRHSGLISSKEGKTYLSFKAYKLIAKKALLESALPRQSLLAHAFTVIAWNLMLRSMTVAPLLWNNIVWSGDCMTITYETSKAFQEGLYVVPRHDYSNALDPVICPFSSRT